MTIILEVAPELENQIKQAAAKVGLSPDAYILESVTQRLQPTQHRPSSVKRLSKREATLLQKINQSLSQMEWRRYQELIGKRQTEILTPEEQGELIGLSDYLEEANVKRIEAIAQLAALRKTTVPSLMMALGLKPATYA